MCSEYEKIDIFNKKQYIIEIINLLLKISFTFS